WERCNSIVLSWFLNSVSEDLFFGQIFSDNASEPIRSSLLSRETLPDVKDAFAIVSREESHRGLASSSSSSGFVTKPQPIRSSLLSRETLPNVKDAFAIVSREESHRGIASSSFGFVTKP
nr:hypothetical protein [Tanacetum cinerariifolium]